MGSKFCQTLIIKPSKVCLRFCKFAQVAKFLQMWSHGSLVTAITRSRKEVVLNSTTRESFLHDQIRGYTFQKCYIVANVGYNVTAYYYYYYYLEVHFHVSRRSE